MMMNDAKQGDPVTRYANVNALMLSTYSEKCLDFSYKNMINDLKKTDWNSSASEGGIYTCFICNENLRLSFTPLLFSLDFLYIVTMLSFAE